MNDATGVDALADDATLEAARHGCREARGRLLCALQDPWYRMCLSLLADADLARDATQETAVRFLRQLPGFRGDSQLRTWSLGIALNVVREMKRRRGRERSLGEGDVDGAEPVAVDLNELQRLGCRVILDNLLEEHGVIRHNPERLARLLLEEPRKPVLGEGRLATAVLAVDAAR